MNYRDILCETRGPVGIVILNQPDPAECAFLLR